MTPVENGDNMNEVSMTITDTEGGTADIFTVDSIYITDVTETDVPPLVFPEHEPLNRKERRAKAKGKRDWEDRTHRSKFY